MLIRRLVAALVLASGAMFLAAQVPDDLAAQDAKLDKSALLKKFQERAKRKADRAKAEAEAKASADAKAKVEADAKAKAEADAAKPTAKVAPAETKPSKPMDVKAVAKFIDSQLDKELKAAKIDPSSRCSDAEFIRRATLDITGVIPTAERVTSFLASSEANKRETLIDELLASPRYGQRLSDIWSNQMVSMDSTTRFVTKQPLVKWLSESFNENKPWDRMAHDIISATGEQDKNGAVVYYMYNAGVDKMTDSVGKLFLGVQIQCAQCHNHPFTTWKQTEYWGMAQFFYNVNITIQRNGKQTDVVPGVSENMRGKGGKGNPLPESAKSVPAKFLGGETVKLTSSKPYRPVLADWLCTSENPFFSKSIVNRVWAQYFGRGLVNPIDDLSEENKPTHPELLQGLAKELSGGGFDLKNLVRAICLSDAYQRTSQPIPSNKADTVLYSHMAIKVLTPEQLYDSLTAVVGCESAAGRPMQKGGNPRQGNASPRDRFVSFFMGSENPKATEYEAGIPQALRLMNNPRLSGSSNVINGIAKSGDEPAKVIERMYLMTLSRKPTEAELKKLTGFIADSSDPKSGYSDVLWVLLNSSEFALNH
ncbi:MAG: DUF1549 and DUF1553 domain-containing protein [Planctomycetes bacterium]|nr:DUF1549 and DUF1553 domain-containing protein [Planctomycetota bacterium]